MSQDGSRLVAVAGLNNQGLRTPIYLSGDGGASWTTVSAPLNTWTAVACSSDGSRILAANSSLTGALYQSTNFGATWTNLTIADYEWKCVASSADGSVLVGATYGGSVWVSSDSGATWSHANGMLGYWTTVMSSAAGDVLVALGGTDRQSTFISRDVGASWQLVTNLPPLAWVSGAMTGDGTKFALLAQTGQIYTSLDAGSSWSSNGIAGATPKQMACSSDGSKLVLGAQNGIYSSPDWGATWAANSAPNNYTFTPIACSADGTKMAAASGQIFLSPPLITPSSVVAWGYNTDGQTIVPTNLASAIAVAASQRDSIAIQPDGTVVEWGNTSLKQTNVPPGLSNVVSVAASYQMTLALKSDGTVASWGTSAYSNMVPTLTNIAAVAASSSDFYAALRSNGTVVVWGYNGSGQTNVPAIVSNIVAIAVGDQHCLALRSDGTMTAWGNGNGGFLPAGISNVISIAAGSGFDVWLKVDGTVGVYPTNNSELLPPAGLSNVVSIAASSQNIVALTSDGSVWEWGTEGQGYMAYRVGLPSASAVACGQFHAVAIAGDGSPFIARQPMSQMTYAGYSASFNVGCGGASPLLYQWQLNGTNLVDATNYVLQLSNVTPDNAGTYALVISNSFGARTSSAATLAVDASAPQIIAQPASKLAPVGTNVTFSVGLAAGPIPVSYQWRWNTTNIVNGTNASLVISNVQALNAGSYDVIVTNLYGQASSTTATLDLLTFATALNTTNFLWTNTASILWFPETSTSHDGVAAAATPSMSYPQKATLQTGVVGPGTLTFWWQATAPVTGIKYFTFAVDGINQASITTGGWQQQTVYLGTNNHLLSWTYNKNDTATGGTSPFAGYLDQVSYVPGGTAAMITSMKPNTTAPAGTNVTITVSAGGTPPFAYAWTFNGMPISSATGASVTLNNVQSTNAGTYSVIVTNVYGTATGTMQLAVTPAPPSILTQPANQTAVRRGNAVFNVSVRGSDPLSYSWQFNGGPMSGATGSQLVVSALDDSSLGSYSVVVSNNYGTATSAAATITFVPTLLVGWGDNFFGQATPPTTLSNVSAFRGGWDFSAAVNGNGTIVNWGFPETAFSATNTNFVTVAAGWTHMLALQRDGTVVTEASPSALAVPSGLSNVTAVAAGNNLSFALKADGTVVGWSFGANGATNIPAGAQDIKAFDCTYGHVVALREDGTVIAWGSWSFGQTNVPVGLSNVVGVAAGWYHSLALKADGTVVAWGLNTSGQTNVPTGLSNVVAIAAGEDYSMALRDDGTVSVWGSSGQGQTTITPIATNVIAIAGGSQHLLALVNDGTAAIVRQPFSRTVLTGSTVVLSLGAAGLPPLSYQWSWNGINIDGATSGNLVLTNVSMGASGTYTCAVSNLYGGAVSQSAVLTVVRSTPQFGNSATLQFNGTGFTFPLQGLSGHGAVVIYASSDLDSWVPIYTNPPLVGTLQLLDTDATNIPNRYYRAEEQ